MGAMITIHGPSWPTVEYLRERLREVSEEGEYQMGGTPKNSIEQLTSFRDAGLDTPDFTEDLHLAMEWVKEGAVVFGRKLFHTRGNDIVLPGRMNPSRSDMLYNSRWRGSEWWSKYVSPIEEWRIHVFDGKIIARGRKVKTGTSWRRAPVRNINNGWTFDFTTEPPKGIRDTARRAIDAVGYGTGAVDILQTSSETAKGKGFVVLECNRIPALTCEYTRGKWVEAIQRKFRDE